MVSPLYRTTLATLLFALAGPSVQAHLGSDRLDDYSSPFILTQIEPTEENQAAPSEEETSAEETEGETLTPPETESIEENQAPPSEEETSAEETPTPPAATPTDPPTEDVPNPSSNNEKIPTEWQEITSTEGQFRVSMPGVPSEQLEAANPQTGSLETGAYIWESEAEPIGYGVFYKILPKSLEPGEESQFLNNFRDDFVANGVLEGKLLEERPINLDEYPGREMEVEGADGFIKARVYLVGDRLYLLIAVSANKTDFPQGGDTFLNSFQILS